MKYLLDTHTAIWALSDKSKLSERAKTIIDDESIPLCVSMASAWEIAIKISLGKLIFAGGSKSFLEKMRINGVHILNINTSHIEQVERLPYIHRDPFDRLLVASAVADGLTIITSDTDIRRYNAASIW